MANLTIERTVINHRAAGNEQMVFIEEHFTDPFADFESLPLEEKWAIIAILGKHSSDEMYRTARGLTKLTVDLLFKEHYHNWTWFKKFLGG